MSDVHMELLGGWLYGMDLDVPIIMQFISQLWA